MKKIVAISSSQDLLQWQMIISDPRSKILRSDEGVNQGVHIFESSLDKSMPLTKVCAKVMNAKCAINVQIADQLFEAFGLQVARTAFLYPENEAFSDMKGHLSRVQERLDSSELKKQLKSKEIAILVMEFVKATTFSDLLPVELKALVDKPSVWMQMGKAYFWDLFLGNHDRFVSLNTGNWMINKETNTLHFIDNNTEYTKPVHESEYIPNDIQKIVALLERKPPDILADFALTLFNTLGVLPTNREVLTVASNLYKGFRSGYAQLRQVVEANRGVQHLLTLGQTEHSLAVIECVMSRLNKIISLTETLVRPICTELKLQVLADVVSGDPNRLGFAKMNLLTLFPDAAAIHEKMQQLIADKKSFKKDRSNQELVQNIKILTSDIISFINEN